MDRFLKPTLYSERILSFCESSLSKYYADKLLYSICFVTDFKTDQKREPLPYNIGFEWGIYLMRVRYQINNKQNIYTYIAPNLLETIQGVLHVHVVDIHITLPKHVTKIKFPLVLYKQINKNIINKLSNKI